MEGLNEEKNLKNEKFNKNNVENKRNYKKIFMISFVILLIIAIIIIFINFYKEQPVELYSENENADEQELDLEDLTSDHLDEAFKELEEINFSVLS